MVATREDRERTEHLVLSEKATFSDASQGRERLCEPDRYRTCFQRDRDRIVHAKAFRRLSHKTQVFLAPEGDHYRTRLTHTLEVSQISRSISRALSLNEDLTEAIALGHDLGHTPFGHAGENALTRCIRYALGIDPEDESDRGRYHHNVQSLRMVDVLENDGAGLNLTYEVRDGILCHTGPVSAQTFEGRVVATADRIAYVNHDIDDAIRAGLITEADLPESSRRVLGQDHSARITSLVEDMVATSEQTGDIRLSDPIKKIFDELRAYLFATVYRNNEAKAEEPKAARLLTELFMYYLEHPEEIPEDVRRIADAHASDAVEGDKRITAIIDYIAGMTDRYARDLYSQLFIPTSWHMR